MYIGYMEADVKLETEKGFRWMKVTHPGGGAAYHLVADFPRLPAGWSLGAVSGVV